MHTGPYNEPIRVLLVEDDEDDYILTRSLMDEIDGARFRLNWIKTFREALEAMVRNEHDVCLIDYRLGAETGIELLQMAIEGGCQAPIILLTGQGEHEIDLRAMKAGASDYLIKGRLDASLLERSIRYAIERSRAAAEAATEQARLARFGAEVGLALTRGDSMQEVLRSCAEAMNQYLNGALARIWTVDPEEQKLIHQASTTPEGSAAITLPKFAVEYGQMAQGSPIVVNHIQKDPRLRDPEWARREGIVSYAGYPLMLENRCVGLMSLFACHPLSEATLQEMGSVANGVALYIERKRSEEALDASEVRYRSVVENIKEIIFQTDKDARWTFLNPAWTEVTGHPVRETVGTCLADYIHPEDRDHTVDLFQQLIERKTSSCRAESRFLARDGTFRWIEVYAQPTLDSNSFGTSGTLSDITERKRAEAEIRKLAAFPRYNPDPVLELAADGTLTYLNDAARDMAHSLNEPVPEAILPPDAAAIARECLRSGQRRLHEELVINGRTLSWSFFPIIASQVVHCYGVDTTERLNLEAQLRHSQKLESIGQLAAGVAHDFNNILTIIQGHADRLLSRWGAENGLKEISEAATRASTLTRQLLMFSRKQVMQPKVLDLNNVLLNLAKMLHRLLGEHISLESRHGENLPLIEGDAGMIEQIIMNLAVNSRDAMEKGGKLVIETSKMSVDQSYVNHQPEAKPGDFVCLSVSDTGEGMDRETLDRVFEPFFTTKEVGKGTGLGLATVYGIAKQHGGWIEVESEVGTGTNFKIFFPATSKSLEEAPSESMEDQSRGDHGRETILLVEDEPVLRELARMILRDYKYEVLEASTGVEALQVWNDHDGKIDLLLTDMVMPEGMSGRELAETLRERKPDLRVIYTSGYSPDVMGQEPTIRDTVFLQKPYPPPQLAKTVRECLEERPALPDRKSLGEAA